METQVGEDLGADAVFVLQEALALGALVLHEKITPVALLCALLVLLGVALVLWPGRARAPAPLALGPRRLI